jgi:predicted RNA-binding Zn-ribbon protein involved in translation (DUF1610 family)
LEKLGGTHIPQADQNRVTAPMYIVRPLKQGERRSLSSAFATHPPLAKRIEVLRRMGGQADYQAYDSAYAQATGQHLIGSRTLSQSQQVSALAPAEAAGSPSPQRRLRAASDAYLAGAGYVRQTCAHCGAIVKVPRARQGQALACPRCGATDLR